jgi:hypothetical protein
MLLASGTNICEEHLTVCKKRHGPRAEGVISMLDGGVPSDSQNDLGNWGGKERRNSHYAYAALDRTAVLAMGGTAKTELGQLHLPTWNHILTPKALIFLASPGIPAQYQTNYGDWVEKHGSQVPGLVGAELPIPQYQTNYGDWVETA